MLPIPAILLLLGPVSNVMRRVSIFDKFFTWLFNRTRRRSPTIQKYQELGLILFIAVPVPATGAWTGSLAAFLFGLRFWLSMFCVFAGVAIADVIVSVFSYFGWAGAVAAGVILSLLATISVLARNKKPVVSAGSSN
ncbi:MAG: small multi-drug export protein [Polyangiaceae bacterium]|nr:small multi-drug export protein [Polyangiaceae bacterium]